MQIILLHGIAGSKHYFDQLKSTSAPRRQEQRTFSSIFPDLAKTRKLKVVSKLRINWSFIAFESASASRRSCCVHWGTRSEVFSLLPGLAKISRGFARIVLLNTPLGEDRDDIVAISPGKHLVVEPVF